MYTLSGTPYIRDVHRSLSFDFNWHLAPFAFDWGPQTCHRSLSHLRVRPAEGFGPQQMVFFCPTEASRKCFNAVNSISEIQLNCYWPMAPKVCDGQVYCTVYMVLSLWCTINYTLHIEQAHCALEFFGMVSNRLFSRLESLALSQKGFWWLKTCRNCRFMKPERQKVDTGHTVTQFDDKLNLE